MFPLYRFYTLLNDRYRIGSNISFVWGSCRSRKQLIEVWRARLTPPRRNEFLVQVQNSYPVADELEMLHCRFTAASVHVQCCRCGSNVLVVTAGFQFPSSWIYKVFNTRFISIRAHLWPGRLIRATYASINTFPQNNIMNVMCRTIVCDACQHIILRATKKSCVA